ncbi:GPI inositol-deacylase [[Candida] jaroonii]|uniref:GPI inositol-deacylase n=1 Tax=[Candida] jaroonii TaxID=467808 RepID=A0ACA9YBK1_9ASCO|nr:GPI inositol-deacylase [[Candida] jaroonii]
MYPSYARIPQFDERFTPYASKYSLYLYREQGKDLKPTAKNNYKLNGIPVLFIPGNAGSYKQARSIASKTANLYFNNEYNGPNTNIQNMDFFTADFNEDFTAFHGRTMLDQAEYANEAIKFILSLYEENITSVLIIGHSMGGIVSRVLMTLPNYKPQSVKSIITLSSPHSKAPLTFDRDIMKIYQSINEFWKLGYSDNEDSISKEAQKRLKDVSLFSITGGLLDNILPADYTTVENLVPKTNGFTVFTSGIEDVWTSIDHLAIVWCDQLRTVISNMLLDMIDPSVEEKVKPLNERMEIARHHLLTFQPINLIEKAHDYENYNSYQGDVALMSKKPVNIVACNETNSCYDVSTQISKVPNGLYAMKLSYPHVYISNEDVTVGTSQTINVDVLAFKTIKIPNTLLSTINLNVDNSIISYDIKFSSPVVTRQYNTIETKWHDSQEFNLNYHGSAPFISFNENLKLDVWNMEDKDLTMHISINPWVSMKLLIIRFRLTIISYGLVVVLMVFLKQMNEDKFPSFNKTLGELLTTKNVMMYLVTSIIINMLINIPLVNKLVNLVFLENEPLLILGVKNFQILNIMFMILSVTFNYIFSYVLEFLSSRKVPTPGHSKRFRMIVSGILLLLTLIYLPYQVIYIICFLVQGFKLFKKNSHFNITIFLMMLWIIPINVPIIIVLIHNISINWRTSFSSHHNILSILPIFTFTNLYNYKFKPSPLIKAFVCYWIGYNWLYGSINTFFMFHLFNYFCVLLLIDYGVEKYL